jgi:hypothetical protein
MYLAFLLILSDALSIAATPAFLLSGASRASAAVSE